MSKKQQIVTRIYIGYLFICMVGIAIVARGFYLQTYKGDYYISLADSLTIYPKKIQAERGNIFAADGRLIATTLPVFDIRIDFKTTYEHKDIFEENVDSFALLLSETFKDRTKEQYVRELWKERKKKTRYYLLKRNVNYALMSEMRNWPLFREGQYKSGLIAVQDNKRLKPFGWLAERTIGYTNKAKGGAGLERRYDSVLTGIEGKVLVQKIAGGITIPLESADNVPSKPGKDVYTTIDIELQDVAEDALYRALKRHGAEHGCVVLMEASTGKIRAIANLGRVKDSTYAEKANYAVGEAEAPGSTFKLVTVAALMEDGFVNNNTIVHVGNGIETFYKLPVRDHGTPETPDMTLKRSIEVSSNVAVAKLADQYYTSNKQKFYNHFERFGFTKKIDIEIDGAAKPVLRQPNKWQGTSVPFLAHGYELQVTPLHTLSFYNAIANNGVMVQPTIIEKITEYNQTVDSSLIKVLNEKLFSPTTLANLRLMLEGVVENGTAKNLKTNYLSIAGKTGTAKIAQGKAGYKNAVYQASFCGYFPAESPLYTMIVSVNSPSQNGYYGNVVAGMVFREVADKVYSKSLKMQKPIQQLVSVKESPSSKKGFAQDLKAMNAFVGNKTNTVSSDWATVNNSGKVALLAELEMSSMLIPDVIGMSLKDALYLLESNGLRVAVVGKGIVKNQSLKAGEPIIKGTQIIIELS
jgi:cell division protein FtsI (penicillin-binding protein 3)